MGILVFDELTSANGTFVIKDGQIQGGLHAGLANEAAISALSASVLVPGMLAFASSSGLYYQFVNSTPSGQFANGSWKVFGGVTASTSSWSSVQATTGSNTTLTGTYTMDSYAIQAGDRIGVVRQAVAAQNGIYVAAAGAWSRSSDANTAASFTIGKFFDVISGSANAGSIWIETSAVTTLGTDAINFEANAAGGVTPATTTVLGIIKLAGDLAGGSANAPMVTGLRNIPVLSQSISTAQDAFFLQYIDHDKSWEAKQFLTQNTTSDVTGTYPSFEVAKLRGKQLSSSVGTPTTNDVLTYVQGNWANVQLGGDASGSIANFAVVSATGKGTQTYFAATASTMATTAYETVMASGSKTPIFSEATYAFTNDGTTWVTAATLTPPTGSSTRWNVTVIGRHVSANTNLSCWSADLAPFVTSKGTGTIVMSPTGSTVLNQYSVVNGLPGTTLGNCSVQVVTASNGNDVLVQVRGSGSAFPMNWATNGGGPRALF